MAQFLEETEFSARSYGAHLSGALKQMNESQRQVCRLRGGLAAVIGVPGSGKTRSLVNLNASLVADGQDPARILAMTFTRNAATEMNDRLLGMGVVGARIGTIHSVCLQIIKSDAPQLLEACALDERDRMAIEQKKLLADMRKAGALPRSKMDKEAISKFVSACKARGCAIVNGDPFGLNMALMDGMYDEAQEWSPQSGLVTEKLTNIYVELEKRRVARGLYSFDDMLLWAWMLMLSSHDARERWRRKYDVVIVDECQDSNPVQWDVARLLVGMPSCIVRRAGTAAEGHSGYIEVRDRFIPMPLPTEEWGSLYVFGDPSQSIYKFRSAVPELFVEFTQREDVDVIPLPYNYRSTPGICHMSTELVKAKTWHLGGVMIPAGRLAGEDLVGTLPRIEGHDYPEEEAAAAIRWAMTHAQGHPEGLRSCAVLSRTSVALHLAEVECIRARIPYRKMASGSFFDSKEVRDVLSYLQVACGRDADGKALQRIVNVPFRFIGRPFIDSCSADAQVRRVSLLDAMLDNLEELGPRQARTIQDFADLLQELNQQAVRSEEAHQQKKATLNPKAAEVESIDAAYRGPAALIATMLDRTGYIDALRAEEGLGEEDSRLACISELQRMAELFRSPLEFLDYVDGLARAVREASKQLKVNDTDHHKPCLTLSTIHRAKGLEWEFVRVVDLVAGRFPHKNAQDQDEELRLLFVAITRARAECIVSHPCGRNGEENGKESPYIGILRHVAEKVTTQEENSGSPVEDGLCHIQG
jgi:DNA helicase-2/ATP-dependent DNA helicase PcrA